MATRTFRPEPPLQHHYSLSSLILICLPSSITYSNKDKKNNVTDLLCLNQALKYPIILLYDTSLTVTFNIRYQSSGCKAPLRRLVCAYDAYSLHSASLHRRQGNASVIMELINIHIFFYCKRAKVFMH